MSSKIKIVKFNNGKYGIRKINYGIFFIDSYFDYLSAYMRNDHWYSTKESVIKHCLCETIEEANMRLVSYERNINFINSLDDGTPV